MLRHETPVLVGAGQITRHPRNGGRDTTQLEGADPPMALASEAARRAVADAAATGDLGAVIDTVVVTRLLSDSSPRRAHDHGRSTNPPRSVARRLGIDPRHAIYAEVGGNTPQAYVAKMAERVASGRAEAVLIAGGEAMLTLKLAAREGSRLDWQEDPGGELDDRGFGPPLLGPADLLHGITYPTQVYPLFEQGIRGSRGSTMTAHLAAMGRLFAPFTRVAAANPYACFRVERSAEELVAVTPQNPFVAFPYPRYCNARDGVDMAAAVVLTSVGRARELGIPRERWVFLHGCAEVDEKLPVLERPDYARSPAIGLATGAALAMSGVGLDDIELIDLYSCFPSAVEAACRELGLAEDDARGLTITGGLPFFGGPGNSYSLHAIAEMVQRLRERDGAYGLVTANGGYLSKHAAGIYSTKPFSGTWRRPAREPLQLRIAEMPSPAIATTPEGPATIETYSVAFANGAPRLGIVVGRLAADGRRFVSNTPEGDTGMLECLVTEEGLGRRGRVRQLGDRNVFELD
jgi:acetyl-CoA C-acetyltransferase